MRRGKESFSCRDTIQNSRMSSGKRLSRCCQGSNRQRPAADVEPTIGDVLKASSGCCVPERDGRICPGNTLRPAPAGDGSTIGKTKASGSTSGARSLANWTSRDDSTGKKPSPTAVLPRQKKGLVHRKDQTRKGYEVDGGGKRPRSSSGSSTCLGVPTRGDADRIDAAAGEGAAKARPTAEQPQTADLRQGRRFRSAAQAAEATRHRFDLSAQVEPKKAADTGWTKTATVQATLEDGTKHRLGGQLQETGGPLRT